MHNKIVWLPILLAASLLAYSGPETPAVEQAADASWTAEFPVEKGELSASGRNPYFILEPGYQLVLEEGKERLTVTVLDETRMVEGVETRVLEERETKAGKLVEVSRNYFAISKRTNSAFYFGEEVDAYKDGKVAGHEGAWLAGVKGARFGLMMPGQVLLKGRYYQELAPGVAMDRAEIVSMSETVKTPAGDLGAPAAGGGGVGSEVI
ncbi:MAG: hypothetical protein DMG07_12705 [Acidobacteria bacterium]|nr:MAG: hypothetical protein DMG07_12705 [Acidobacteriota bacterium]